MFQACAALLKIAAFFVVLITDSSEPCLAAIREQLVEVVT
jgi:hypothetical protein